MAEIANTAEAKWGDSNDVSGPRFTYVKLSSDGGWLIAPETPNAFVLVGEQDESISHKLSIIFLYTICKNIKFVQTPSLT